MPNARVMRRAALVALLTLAAALVIPQSASAQATAADAEQAGDTGRTSVTLTIEFSELRNRDGQLLILVFGGNDGFPDQPEAAIWQGTSPITSVPMRVTVELPSDHIPAEVAVSAVHDENANGTMDTNFLGIPREGFGFSANRELSRLRRPTFIDAAIPLPQDGGVLSVRVRYLL